MEMYSNLLKKYINPEKDDYSVTADEAKSWAAEVRESFPELSAALESFFSAMDGVIGGAGGLSDLSKGIQGITETTAQALEALLNSIRFYVADSNLQMKNLTSVFTSNDVSRNPILNELRQHTAILKSIEGMFESVIGRGGSSHIGGYIKVKID